MDRKSTTTQSELKSMLCDETTEPNAMSLSLLEEITKCFSCEQEIGRGGFAVVYKGILDNGATVAVKRLSDTYLYEKQFHREIECLIKVKHKNVVRFIGYCADSQGKAESYNGKFVMADVQQRLLCFEYLTHGTLDKHITDASCGLDWRTRYKIINGICNGLHYLHQNRIVHLDLKPQNILLDGNMLPKIADFGLSRCFDEKQSRAITTKIGGTIGYLAPESGSCEITYQFDLYSLGVVIMEILTGKKGYEAVEDVLKSWSNRLEITHKEIQLEQIRVCTMVGIECREFNPAKRPANMQHIIARLHGTENTEASIKAVVTKSSVLQGSQGDREKAEEIPAEDGVSPSTILTSKTSAAIDWMLKYPIIGRELEMNELRQYTYFALFNSLQVVSVWGIAGVGKSALVRNLFCDRILTKGLFEKYGWADVSHPFNLRDFSRSLLLDFNSESFQAKETVSHGTIRFKDPIQECRDLLEQHHCLVIIDDLQSKEEWDLIKAALLSKPSKTVIIAISTEASIATSCADKEELVFHVKGLQLYAAFDLFHQEVDRKNPLSILKNIKEERRLIDLIFKCGGLPKVIIAVAGVLAKKTVTLMDTIGSTNNRFMHTLETNPEYDSLRGLFSSVYSYFHSCPDSLRPCIFYMSIFHRDSSVRRRRVVRRWVAEGYSRDRADKSAEQNGEKFFSDLVDLSIIQHPPQLVTANSGDRRMTSCRLNGFIREYIFSRRMEEDLVFVLEGCCDITTQRTGRHLVISETWDRDKIVFESMDFSGLWSLTVYGGWQQFFISKRMKLLRVLDLEDAAGVYDADLEHMLKLLRHLEFLSLRGCSKIHSLTSSLGELRQLQTLDIRHTSIVKLPRNIIKLEKLQYIRAGTSQQSSTPRYSVSKLFGQHHLVGVMVPGKIDNLTALHTLGVVNIGASGGDAILNGLKDLTQLHKLGVSGINKKNIEKFSSAISGHVCLESLSVQLNNGSQGCLTGVFLPLKTLQSLKLHGPVKKLPVLDVNELSKLTKLDLEMTILTETDIKLIGSLPKLCTLRIKLLQDCHLHFCVKIHGLEVRSYGKVKVLDIFAYSSRLDVTFGTETMRNLELLKANCCNGSSVKFSGLDNPTELKVVLLKGCFDEELKEEVRSQLREHPKKPILKHNE